MKTTIRNRLAAIGWGSRESLPSLRSWLLGLVLGALLLLLVVALLESVPASWFSSRDHFPHPTGNTIFQEFISRPFSILIVLIPAVLVWWILSLERGRKDRHDPLILVAVVLGALGCGAAFSGAMWVMAYRGEWRPAGLYTLAVGALAMSALLSVTGLAILLITRSPRRGRMFALFLLVWSSWFGGVLYAFVLVPRDPPPALRDGIELPRVSEGVLLDGMDELYWNPMSFPRGALGVHASGDIEWEGEGLGNGHVPDDGKGLRRALSTIASRMPVTEKFGEPIPDGALNIRADRRAPAAVVARIISGCQEEEIGIWRIRLEVELTRVQEGLPNWGYIATYLPKPGREGNPGESPGKRAVAPEEVIEIRAVEVAGGGVTSVYRYLGEDLVDCAQLLDRVRVGLRDAARREKRWCAPQLVRIDPRLSWGTVATALSELARPDTGKGDGALDLVGLELLED